LQILCGEALSFDNPVKNPIIALENRYTGNSTNMESRKKPDAERQRKGAESESRAQAELRKAKEKAENISNLFTDLYVEIYNFSPAGYFRINHSGNIVELNINGAKMLAKDRSRLINKPFSDFIAVESQPVFQNFFDHIFENSDKDSCEVIVDGPDGTRNYLLIEGMVSESKDKCLLAAINITRRKLVESELKESERNFRNLFEHLPIGISMTTMDHVINVNEAMCRMFGYSKEELRSKKWMEITHPDDVLPTQMAINSMLNGEKAEITFEKRFIHKTGRIINTELSSYLQRDESGVPQFLITAVIEIPGKDR
jgi:PAS domain S-box-containing protein